MVRTCRGMARFLFEHKDNTKLTSKMLQKIFKPEFPPLGSNRRSSQEIVFAKFLDLSTAQMVGIISIAIIMVVIN